MKISPQELAEQARHSYQAGDFFTANMLFEKAATAYTEANDPLMSAEMKNNQSVTLLRDKKYQAALQAASGTEAIFEAAGDNRRQGMALANQASALVALNEHQQAIDFYIRAGEALDKAGEMDLRLDVMQLLSILYLRRFKLFDAIIAYQSGLSAIKNPTLKQRIIKKLLFIRL